MDRLGHQAVRRPRRIGLDVRGHTLAARGWVKEGGDLFETMKFLDSVGCSRYVVTDVARDA